MAQPKSDTARGTQTSGPAHTNDPDDNYGAGESRTNAKRADDVKYHDEQPRAGGREREDDSLKTSNKK